LSTQAFFFVFFIFIISRAFLRFFVVLAFGDLYLDIKAAQVLCSI
jgi:hypothetical protein